jgi:hypothetical protein
VAAENEHEDPTELRCCYFLHQQVDYLSSPPPPPTRHTHTPPSHTPHNTHISTFTCTSTLYQRERERARARERETEERVERETEKARGREGEREREFITRSQAAVFATLWTAQSLLPIYLILPIVRDPSLSDTDRDTLFGKSVCLREMGPVCDTLFSPDKHYTVCHTY